MRPAVFLDRDGTMIHEAGYLSRFDDLRWYPWTADAIRLLNRAGLAVCVTTNQGGIGLKLFTEAFVDDLHARMTSTLAAADAHVDGWFYCPHHPSAVVDALRVACECRKPQGGLAREAARQLGLDLARSFVIGDRVSDLGMARAVGATAVLVRTGHGEAAVRAGGGRVDGADHVAADLMAATSWVLGRARPREDAA